jgi:hypothetical protein
VLRVGTRGIAVGWWRTGFHQRKTGSGDKSLALVHGKISPFRFALLIALKVGSQRRELVVK